MLVNSPKFIGSQTSHNFASNQINLCATSRPSCARCRNDYNISDVGKLCCRCCTQSNRCCITTRISHSCRLSDCRTGTWKFWSAIGPCPGVSTTVILFPLITVFQTVICTKIDNLRFWVKGCDNCRALAMWQRKEN